MADEFAKPSGLAGMLQMSGDAADNNVDAFAAWAVVAALVVTIALVGIGIGHPSEQKRSCLATGGEPVQLDSGSLKVTCLVRSGPKEGQKATAERDA